MNANDSHLGGAINLIMTSRLSLYQSPRGGRYPDGAFNDSYRITFTGEHENVREIFFTKVVAQVGTRWGFASRSKTARKKFLDTEKWLIRDHEFL